MGIISGLFTARQSDVGMHRRDVLLRRLSLISESDQLPDPDTKERGLTSDEISAFKYCLSISGDPKKGEGCKAELNGYVLGIRPRSIPHFRKVLDEHGLGNNLIIAGLLRHLESDCNLWLKFGHE